MALVFFPLKKISRSCWYCWLHRIKAYQGGCPAITCCSYSFLQRWCWKLKQGPESVTT